MRFSSAGDSARWRLFFLYVGGLSPHKNLLRLVEAFARAAPADVKLVLAGDVNDVFHTHVPQIRAAIAQHGVSDRVILTGFVADDDLAFLYSRAYALVQPSLLEGFGLPAVEAMACGTRSSPAGPVRCRSRRRMRASISIRLTSTRWPAPSALPHQRNAARCTRGDWPASGRAFFSWDRSARALLACFDEIGDEASQRLAPP